MIEPLRWNWVRVDEAIGTRVIRGAEIVDASDVYVPLEQWRLRETLVSSEDVSGPW